MTKVKTIESARLLVGLRANLAGGVYEVCGFKFDGKNICFTFRHENGQEITLDSQTCLECVTVDGMPMGEL